jgi:hypothetical protein
VASKQSTMMHETPLTRPQAPHPTLWTDLRYVHTYITTSPVSFTVTEVIHTYKTARPRLEAVVFLFFFTASSCSVFQILYRINTQQGYLAPNNYLRLKLHTTTSTHLTNRRTAARRVFIHQFKMASISSSSSIPRIAVLGSLNMDLVAYVPHRMFTQLFCFLGPPSTLAGGARVVVAGE